jgi:hypothetical protein
MKFYLSKDDAISLTETRRKVFAESTDRELYLHVGYFMLWYAACELRITLLLATVTKSKDMHAFALLTKGMDAPTKIRRLRSACERSTPIGQNLEFRLRVFERHMVPLRNKLVHTYPVGDGKRNLVCFNTLANIPMPGRSLHPDEETISFLEFFEHGVWLNLFNEDLKPVCRSAAHAQTLEIASPQSPLLPGQHPSPSPSTKGSR